MTLLSCSALFPRRWPGRAFFALCAAEKGKFRENHPDSGIPGQNFPPYEIAEAKRRMTSVAVQIGVTAGAWLLVVAVYTAIYIPRRKKIPAQFRKERGQVRNYGK